MQPQAPSRFRFSIQTLGCKANLTDSQNLSDRLIAEGGLPLEDGESASPDVLIVNSCTVTDRADRDALALLSKEKAGLKVFTGCLAEVDPNAAQGNDVLVARNSGKQDLPARILERLGLRPGMSSLDSGGTVVGDRVEWHRHFDHAPGASLRGAQRTRAFLKVQDGCNQFCAYCIIPQARGRSRSLGSEEIIREIDLLVNAGVQEVVLTAIHAADYEAEGLDYTGLVEKVLLSTKVARLRLTSLDPAEIKPELLSLMATEPRLCPHFHVSMQSGSTSVLQAMDRAYDAKRAEDCLVEIHERIPQSFVGMDMIAGFPGETDEHHRETMGLLERSPWTRIHVFPYSVRRSTKAARMVAEGQGVPEAVKRARAKEMRQLSQARYQKELLGRQGKLMEILTEEKSIFRAGQEFSSGHSRSYFRVVVPGKEMPNQRRRIMVTGADLERELLLGTYV